MLTFQLAALLGKRGDLSSQGFSVACFYLHGYAYEDTVFQKYTWDSYAVLMVIGGRTPLPWGLCSALSVSEPSK